jgi:hypothetical protein
MQVPDAQLLPDTTVNLTPLRSAHLIPAIFVPLKLTTVVILRLGLVVILLQIGDVTLRLGLIVILIPYMTVPLRQVMVVHLIQNITVPLKRVKSVWL